MKSKFLVLFLALTLTVPALANRIKTVQVTVENASGATLSQKEIVFNREMHFRNPGVRIDAFQTNQSISSTSDESNTTNVQMFFDVLRYGRKLETVELFWATNMGIDGNEFHICGNSDGENISVYCDLPSDDPSHPDTLYVTYHIEDR